MEQKLITVNEVGELARPISNHIDDARINIYIQESEDIDFKPTLGDALLIDIRKNPDKYKDLLEGGTYTYCGVTYAFCGLKKVLAYYTYARVVKNNDLNVTRFGVVYKNDDYSDHVNVKERVMAYNDAFAVADGYMRECTLYLSRKKDLYPMYKGHGNVKATRIQFKTIGD